MNLDRDRAIELANAVHREVGGSDIGVDVGLFPAFVHLDAVAMALATAKSKLFMGGQDGYMGDEGAFTGEVSMPMLADIGAKAVLAGHSERRHVLGENDELIHHKVVAGLEAGLIVVLCVGEKLDQREAGETDRVNRTQVRAALDGIEADRLRGKLVIAYEPVWAIGTGKTATPQDAQDAHFKIRAVMTTMFGDDLARETRILYGGSVKAENAKELFAGPDVDGGLVGGASLNASGFAGIVRAAAG